MAVNYTVQAEVVDIKYDRPQPDDIFLVDSNVWYWLTYSQASTTSLPYQIRDYPAYISQARSNQSLLLYSGLSLAELAHLIEASERDIFINSRGAIKPKEYRHNLPAERGKVVAEVQAAWSQVKTMAAPLDVLIDDATADAALTRFTSQLLDGYDLFILETMTKEGIVNLITDDGDFVTVPGIKVFTSNRHAITAASNQGKLLVR